MTAAELKALLSNLMEGHIEDRCCSEQERDQSRAKLVDALATIDLMAAASSPCGTEQDRNGSA